MSADGNVIAVGSPSYAHNSDGEVIAEFVYLSGMEVQQATTRGYDLTDQNGDLGSVINVEVGRMLETQLR